jgi:aminoglycoside phosphotransferase (APT) family kinase protein
MKKEKMDTEYRKFSLEKAAAQKVFDKFSLGAVESISRFEQGMINDVYSINGQYVLKVNFAHPELPKLTREAAIYTALPQYGIPVPKLYAHEESKDLLGYPYILMGQLPGGPIKETWRSLDEEQKAKTIFELGRLLGSIHNIRPDQVSLDEQDFSGNLREDINSRIAKIGEELRSSKVLDEQTISRIENYYQESGIFNNNEVAASLLHGNYVFGNIITSDQHVQGIIDWEWAKFGHDEEELANVLYRGPGPSSVMGSMSKDLLENFKKGYVSVHPLSTEFEERYLPYALLYFLKVLPSVPQWTHRPDKQKEYMDETNSLIKQIGI